MKVLWLARLVSILCMVCLFVGNVWAKDQILLKEFAIYLEKKPERLVANIQFDYELNNYLRESLLNGVTLRSEVRFDVIWYNEWWFNKRERLTTIVTELKYHALSGHYQLVRKDSNENWNFSSLAAALEHMGKIGLFQLPNVPADVYSGDASLFVDAVLEPESPDLPLNLSSLFLNKHRLVNEGAMWTIPR